VIEDHLSDYNDGGGMIDEDCKQSVIAALIAENLKD
jgi:hypothetical protein